MSNIEITNQGPKPFSRPALAHVLRCCPVLADDDHQELFDMVEDMIAGLKPQNTLEQILVGQIVGTHLQAMGNLAQLGKYSNDEAKAASYALITTRLQRGLTQLITILTSLRGGRSQHIKVEHMNINQYRDDCGAQTIPVADGGKQ